MKQTVIFLPLLMSLFITACDGGTAPTIAETPSPHESARAPRPATEALPTESAPPVEVPAVVLAETPRIDLLDNRDRWHLYRDGLVLPFGSEGIRKYTQEYRRPLGPLVSMDGRTGRALDRTSVTLTIPWEQSGPATARLFLHGVSSGQRVQLDVNGKRAGTIEVPAEWSQQTLAIPAEMLRVGENSIRLTARKASTVGGVKTFGLYHAIELVPGDAESSQEWPDVSPATEQAVGDVKKRALAHFPRMSMMVEVPETGWLRVDVSADAATPMTVRIRNVDGSSTSVLEATATPGTWTRHDIDLAAFAGELVALEFESTGGFWAEPFIGLAEAEVRDRPPAVENVILLVVDALRADRLPLYGQSRVQTPRMAAAGKHAAVFRYNLAAAPSSPPSHGSIQTGMLPRVHGVTGDKGRIKAGTPLLSSQLEEAGISTAYIGNNSFGMNRLREAGKWQTFKSPISEGKGADCEALVGEVLSHVEKTTTAGERFFVSALPMEPHTPYRFHEGISDKYHDGPWSGPVGKFVDGYLLGDIVNGKKNLTEEQWAQLRALYDGEIEHMDRCFGQLWDGLAELGLTDSTAIVLTSDHGEGMFEHGKLGHAYGHYAELSNVPFVVFAPGVEQSGPRNIDVVTSCIDVAPTILDLMGVTPAPAVQGASMLPVMLREGPWVPRIMSTEYGRSYALRSARWKLIVDYDGTEHFFDVATDPLEQNNLVEKDHFALRYMRDQVGFFLEHRSEWRNSTWGTLGNFGAGFIDATAAKFTAPRPDTD